MSSILSLDEIRSRVAERQAVDAEAAAEQSAAAAASQYRYVKPLTSAAEGLIDYAANPDGRFMLGIRDLDAMTRGFNPGEMVYIVGRAHSGKTQLVMQAIVNNPDKRWVVFTPDEIDVLVLSKLISIKHQISAEEVEERIKAGDANTIAMVRKAAASQFKNLVVIDETLTLDEMTEAMREAKHYLGGKIDVVVYDFLELLPTREDDQGGVPAKSKGLKRWYKQHDVVGLTIHQSAKSTAPRGKSGGMDAMRYGGDTEATFVLEVFRRTDDESLDEFDRQRHAKTVTVNLCKNKRPPSKKGEVDLYLDPDCGLVRKLEPETDMVVGPQPGVVMSTTDDLWIF